MSFDTRALRTAFGRFATGIAVVTAQTTTHPVGITINSLASVSLEPALLLFCLKSESRHLAAFDLNAQFAVNILGETQRVLSDGYAMGSQQTTLLPGMIDRGTVPPIVDQALCVFDCHVVQQVDAGDHKILIGKIDQIIIDETLTADPLLYVQGRYRRLNERDADVSPV